VFFISLKSSWSVDVQNGLAWSIWTSAAQKKGQESNWQFDSRPLKVKNRPDPGVCRGSATHRWKGGELQLCFRPHPNQRSELGVKSSQSPGSPNRDSFGTPPWKSRDKKSFGCRSCARTQRILYGKRWWLPPSPGRGESSESVLPMACPNTKVDPEWRLTNLWLVLMQDRVAN
jgi:hypothetical protein